MAGSGNQDLTQDVIQTSDALGRIAQDENAFRLLVESFRAQDYETFHDLLGRYQLGDRCDLVCNWLCSKECVLICFELCGPPPQEPVNFGLREYGEVIARITADEEVLESLVGAVIERDERAFQSIVEKLGVQRFCHYICHWICTIRCRLICEILCAPANPLYLIGSPHLEEAIQQASSFIARLAADPGTLEIVEKGVLARNCDIVRPALERAGFQGSCRWVCEWICSWRCVRVCLLLCRPYPPVRIEREFDEIYAFAGAVAGLVKQPELTARLVDAVESENADAYAGLVKELGFTRYCHQLCHWLCYLSCWRFCVCICPPPRPHPWFTHVGHFHIYGDIDSGTGLTNKAVLSHGGPNYGFFDCLELRGFCPADSPTSPGIGMRYRFLYERGGSRTPLVGSLLCPVIVGSRTIFWDVNGTGLEETFQTVMIAGSGATPDPTPPPVVPPGTPWGPPPTHVIVPDVDGWITVDPNALGNSFNGALIGFNSPVPFPGGDPMPGVSAGAQVPNANLKNGVDIAIIFEATRVGGPVSPPDFTNSLSRIHINNWNVVALLDLLQFHSGGTSNPCSPLTTDLDVEYTTDHELMASWSLTLETAASPAPVISWPSGTFTRTAGANSAFGTQHENISTWPTCSYTVKLNFRRALTTGLVDDGGSFIYKTFCIGLRSRREPR
ncbi:MAG TPA: hypothetical protein VMT46_08690 [Anaerolineaceae bacterium]|nr:hypothetical protein [Anaerolineaceae bacterium]